MYGRTAKISDSRENILIEPSVKSRQGLGTFSAKAEDVLSVRGMTEQAYLEVKTGLRNGRRLGELYGGKVH